MDPLLVVGKKSKTNEKAFLIFYRVALIPSVCK
jgi:hypothetical protein